MKKLFVFYGTNGAGKTTLAKSILMSDSNSQDISGALFDAFDWYDKNTEFGHYTVSKGGKFVAMGKYSTNCGGADTIKTVEDYYSILKVMKNEYPDSDLIVEGVLQKAFEGLVECFKGLQKEGYSINLVFLDISIDLAHKRVLSRSGKEPNVEIMNNKIKNTGNLFKKLSDTKLFNTFTIKVDGKTKEKIYEEFLLKIR